MSEPELLLLARQEATWAQLHQLCLERATAEELARALERCAPEMAYEATVWAGVLREMHPGLTVNLPATGGSGL